MSAEIITLRPHADAPVQPFSAAPAPRSSFGLRPKITDLPGSVGAAFEIARDADKEQQARIKRLAREARNAFDGAHVCPSLVVSLAARVTGLATHALALAEEAKSLGLLRGAVSLREHAGLLEALAAEIDPTPPEMPA